MKILVLSDSHGNLTNMEQAVERTNPNLIVHLGDCWRDGERLHEHFPEIPLEQVPGNCDFRPGEPAEKLLILRDKRILICHGHTYGVKQSLLNAGYAIGPVSLRPHPPAAGGYARPNPVSESRQHWGLCPSLLRCGDH